MVESLEQDVMSGEVEKSPILHVCPKFNVFTLEDFKIECKFVQRRFRQNHISDVHNGHALEDQNGSMQCARIHTMIGLSSIYAVIG